nr:hypothetical protein [Anaerolineae bacterium]
MALLAVRSLPQWSRLVGTVVLGLIISLSPASPAQADPPPAVCTPPLEPVTLVNPTVITNCSNQTQLADALVNGGHITFNCGAGPVTIPITSELVTSATQDIVLDGQGLVTLDGQNTTRILNKPFTPNSHVDKTLGNDLTLQNIRLINAKAPAATQTQDSNARGGAVWVTSPGTRLHLI